MKPWKRKLIWAFGILIGLLAAYAGGILLSLDYWVDYWWFSSLDLGAYYTLRLLYRYLVLGGAVALIFLIFFLNFFVAARFLGTRPPEERADGGKAKRVYSHLVRLFLVGSMKVYAPLSLILAFIISMPLFEQWEATLLYLFGPKSDVQSVLFGKDVSYYLFSFPIYTLLERRLLLCAAVALLGTVLLYWQAKRLMDQKGEQLPTGARVHLSFLLVLLIGIQIWGFLLQRHGLLFSTGNMPLFSGPGYAEIKVTLPLLWMSMGCLAGLAGSLVFFIHTRKGWKFLAAFGLLFLILQGLQQTPYLANWVQEYYVTPNAIEKEEPYIANSIQATLAAYGLDKVEIRNYEINQKIDKLKETNPAINLNNVPVWDRELLKEVYDQLQGIKTYYRFPNVDVDRYKVEDRYQQVYLSAREVDIKKLPLYAQNWINKHLRYTHGNGVVMTPAAQDADEGMTWFIKDVPPTSNFGITMKVPRIYFGTNLTPYVVVPNDTGEMDSFVGGIEHTVNYEGTGGVPVAGFWKKLFFAFYFKERDILFTSKTNKDSRILFHRNIKERVEHVAPFLRIDDDPYVVVTPQRLYWIVDTYTTSPWYPAAASFDGKYNTIRNSIKVVVDAYNGTVTPYLVDDSDPIARAYQRMYPGLIKPLNQMPVHLRRHMRYPKDLFTIQMEMYNKYHQKNPSIFFQEQDAWEFSQTYRGDKRIPIKPYYLTLDLLEPGEQEFFLLLPLNPIRRDNLRALAIGRSDGDHYGKIVVYLMPEGQQVYGPAQIGTVIDIDTDIAEQFTLWNQVGSEVVLGRMVMLPIANKIVYVQPVYLRSTTASRFPELKRLIVCMDDIAVMEPTLKSALLKVRERLLNRQDRFNNADEALQKAQTIEEVLTAPGQAQKLTPTADSMKKVLKN